MSQNQNRLHCQTDNVVHYTYFIFRHDIFLGKMNIFNYGRIFGFKNSDDDLSVCPPVCLSTTLFHSEKYYIICEQYRKIEKYEHWTSYFLKKHLPLAVTEVDV